MVRFLWRGDPRRRNGLTQRDVIVAMLALTLLCAVIMAMFPVVSGPVDAIGINRCMNNLSSLGKGLAGYQSASGNAWPSVSTKPVDCAPASFRNPASRKKGDKAAGYSWTVQLLPYMGEDPMYKQIAIKSDGFKRSAFDLELVDANDKHFATNVLKFLQCPEFQGEAEINYTSVAPEYQRFAKNAGDGANAVALTNYVAISATHLSLVSPADGRTAKPNGVIFYSESGKGPTKIPDGVSNTLVVTETREPGYASWYDGTTSWVVAHDPNSAEPVLRDRRWVCEESAGCRSSLATSMDENADGENEAYFYRKRWAGEAPWRFGPSSMHAGGQVNHLFADGRVDAIQASGPNTISASVYFALVTRDGGEPDKIE